MNFSKKSWGTFYHSQFYRRGHWGSETVSSLNGARGLIGGQPRTRTHALSFRVRGLHSTATLGKSLRWPFQRWRRLRSQGTDEEAEAEGGSTLPCSCGRDEACRLVSGPRDPTSRRLSSFPSTTQICCTRIHQHSLTTFFLWAYCVPDCARGCLTKPTAGPHVGDIGGRGSLQTKPVNLALRGLESEFS